MGRIDPYMTPFLTHEILLNEIEGQDNKNNNKRRTKTQNTLIILEKRVGKKINRH